MKTLIIINNYIFFVKGKITIWSAIILALIIDNNISNIKSWLWNMSMPDICLCLYIIKSLKKNFSLLRLYNWSEDKIEFFKKIFFFLKWIRNK